MVPHQYRPHEYSHPTTPYSRLDEITRNVPVEYVDNATLHGVELACPEHGLRILNAIAGSMPRFEIIFGGRRCQTHSLQAKASCQRLKRCRNRDLGPCGKIVCRSIPFAIRARVSIFFIKSRYNSGASRGAGCV
jgi:hypothetical protein